MSDEGQYYQQKVDFLRQHVVEVGDYSDDCWKRKTTISYFRDDGIRARHRFNLQLKLRQNKIYRAQDARVPCGARTHWYNLPDELLISAIGDWEISITIIIRAIYISSVMNSADIY